MWVFRQLKWTFSTSSDPDRQAAEALPTYIIEPRAKHTRGAFDQLLFTDLGIVIHQYEGVNYKGDLLRFVGYQNISTPLKSAHYQPATRLISATTQLQHQT